MARPSLTQLLSGLAVALSVASMVLMAAVAIQSGEGVGPQFLIPLIISIGAGSRFFKSRISAKLSTTVV